MGCGITLYLEDVVNVGPVILEWQKLPTGNTWKMDAEVNEF